ncbi:MAG: TatD family hydrolase [Muribaculaceae bacterium]|nr:TatD family hydrolase [Muribaculaceae bacterium]
MLLDIHSHRPAPYPEGVVSLASLAEPLLPGQLYSAGIHPWTTGSLADEDAAFARLEQLVALPQVVAIGECGVDPLRGAPMYRQIQILTRQCRLAEAAGKPLLLHAVKSADIILGLKKDLNPSVPWIIHGFRGKPATAQQLTAKGLYLSFGENFNPASVVATPSDKLLAETDESALSIEEIISRLSAAAGSDLFPVIAANTAALLAAEGQ